MGCQLVTGGAGFIGSCYVLAARAAGIRVITLDKLSYSGNLDNLAELEHDTDHYFIHSDIGDAELVTGLLQKFRPQSIINFAAESHVDRSILDPEIFAQTNVLGTVTLLRTALSYWQSLEGSAKEHFRFLHVSTDEVFGTLKPEDAPFTEITPYAPNSPYAASKAASDHFARSFYETFGLPVLITNCSNNYGPRQFPEKLIPLTLLNALSGLRLPVYGTGENIRDWLHVEDHCRAIRLVLEKGEIGRTYAIGGRAERTNISVVRSLCTILDTLRPNPAGSYEQQIAFVGDRPGHDWRYAIDCSSIESELGWRQQWTFEEGLKATVQWYLDNPEWTRRVQTGAYREWVATNYSSRR